MAHSVGERRKKRGGGEGARSKKEERVGRGGKPELDGG